MFDKLVSAAKNRANRIRAKEHRADKVGKHDMFAWLLDYTSDQLETPPMLQVEKNFQLLVGVIEEMQMDINNICMTCNITQCKSYDKVKLNPVQGQKYTILS